MSTCELCGRQTKTKDSLEYHTQMRHPKNATKEPGLISPKTSLESIRSKYILSKTIDGLEKSAIVETNLTVCMMEMKESFVF